MPDPRSELFRQVSRERLTRDIRTLATTWPTRHTLSRHHVAIVEYLELRLKMAGLPVERHEYRIGSIPRFNVVATIPGRRAAPATLVCAHFDSRQQDLGAAEAPAPGANDNATGTAVLLEAARLFAAHPDPARDTLRLVLFSGEEQGLLGSTAYASRPENVRDLRLVFNIDQIGYPPADRALFIDRDEGGQSENNARSAELARKVAAIAREQVKVPTRFDPAYGSDYIPFERAGLTVTGLYEAGKDYPQYHRDTDTPNRVDYPYVTDMARLAVAAIDSLARGA